ncbi:MAG TPA: hypothetical protein DEQ40_08840 [Oxalobacteraceae bacterium]|jgi:hypothetical protein|nr:hypothetical protein [Oxalobacteraceae bacterium]
MARRACLFVARMSVSMELANGHFIYIIDNTSAGDLPHVLTPMVSSCPVSSGRAVETTIKK